MSIKENKWKQRISTGRVAILACHGRLARKAQIFLIAGASLFGCKSSILAETCLTFLWQMAQELAREVWQALSAGEGSKGQKLYDWARIPLSVATQEGLLMLVALSKVWPSPVGLQTIAVQRGGIAS